jgi:hypothetical protein
MSINRDPKWLVFLSRRMPWLAIPNIAAGFAVVQILGFFLVFSQPMWFERLVLIPDAVWQGEIWRLVSFVAIPLSMSLLGFIFAVAFSFFILNSIENEWGAFKTTLYVLVSIVVTALFSMIFNFPILEITGLASTFFLAAAALFPEQEIQIYFLIPVKMKFLGWLALAFLAFKLFQGSWFDRLFLLAIYSNYLLFFGPTLLYRVKEWKRRRDFKANWR